MINKINMAQGVQNVQFKQASKIKETENAPVTVPDNEVSFKGAEALANYNKPNILSFDKSILNVEPILPTVIKPDAIGSIDGEKIYGSNGKLNSIINRVGDKVVVYTASPENDNMFESIVTTDKKTGNVIKKQINEIEDGKYKEMRLQEFDSVTGKETKFSVYEDGEPVVASKTVYEKNGMTQYVDYDYEDGHYHVNETFGDERKYNKHYEFNKNKELMYVNERKGDQHTGINFYNGAVISVNRDKTEVFPNNMGREIMSDPDLVPASVSSYPDSIEGEKTFYSNGSLESVTAGDLVYNYSSEGDIISIKDGNKTITINNSDETEIVEDLGDGATKSTSHIDNGIIIVVYKKGDYSKHINIENGLPRFYIEENGDRMVKQFHFNEKGMLESAWGDDI